MTVRVGMVKGEGVRTSLGRVDISGVVTVSVCACVCVCVCVCACVRVCVHILA